jgi:RNA polymerase sigma-70 factor (ECF subfamily)
MGDLDAFEELVRRHQHAAAVVAHAIAGSDGDDAVQEGFVKAFRYLHRFRDGASFRPWVVRIVANEAKNARRSAGRRVALTLRTVSEPHPDGASADEAVLRDDQRAALAAAVAALPEADRLVIAYRWFAELGEAEMAEALGCRPGTVKSRLFRAHQRLKAQLPHAGLDDDRITEESHD